MTLPIIAKILLWLSLFAGVLGGLQNGMLVMVLFLGGGLDDSVFVSGVAGTVFIGLMAICGLYFLAVSIGALLKKQWGRVGYLYGLIYLAIIYIWGAGLNLDYHYGSEFTTMPVSTAISWFLPLVFIILIWRYFNSERIKEVYQVQQGT